MKNLLLGCDWGTTSFRLRLIKTSDRTIVDEVTATDGIATTFTAWQAQGEPNDLARQRFYRHILQKHIDALASKVGFTLAKIPIVVSGMASSSIGMIDVPYATLPFTTDGQQASTASLPETESFPHAITLISGVRSETDVMRGEETQLIGLMAQAETLTGKGDKSLFIFPGTHAKHIYVTNEQIVDFKTYMTGEVFSLMATQSILKDSIDMSGGVAMEPDKADAFRQGVTDSTREPVLNSLFKVRTNQLFSTFSKPQNSLYLSGLLIGSELSTLVQQPDWQIVLCSGNNLFEAYKLGVETLGLDSRTAFIPAETIDKQEYSPTNLIISLLDENHLPVYNWYVVHALPKRLEVSSFNAERNELVIETMVLGYHYIKYYDPASVAMDLAGSLTASVSVNIGF